MLWFQSATVYPPVVSSGKPLMPSEVMTFIYLLFNYYDMER